MSKLYRTTPKPETHITSRRKSLRWRENEKQSTKTYTSTAAEQQRHSHHYPPPPRLPPTCMTTRDVIIRWKLYEYVGIPVVAAAAACRSFRGYENPPPPNETHAITREGRRTVSAQLAGRVVRTCIMFWPWWGLSVSKSPTCSNESS